jgi:hypothetical protein
LERTRRAKGVGPLPSFLVAKLQKQEDKQEFPASAFQFEMLRACKDPLMGGEIIMLKLHIEDDLLAFSFQSEYVSDARVLSSVSTEISIHTYFLCFPFF